MPSPQDQMTEMQVVTANVLKKPLGKGQEALQQMWKNKIGGKG